MFSGDIRFCDVCGEEIPKGEKHQEASAPPETAALLAAPENPEVRATWTTNADGTVTIDTCLACTLAMEKVPSREEMN